MSGFYYWGAEVADVEVGGVDVEVRQFGGKSFAEGCEEAFGCCVGEEHAHGVDTENGAHECDFACAAGAHLQRISIVKNE